MKGIRINGANISEHDLEYRLSHMREFIEKGNRVKGERALPWSPDGLSGKGT